jgi:hypothetical protein
MNCTRINASASFFEESVEADFLGTSYELIVWKSGECSTGFCLASYWANKSVLG